MVRRAMGEQRCGCKSKFGLFLERTYHSRRHSRFRGNDVMLDGEVVTTIYADLTAGNDLDLTLAKVLVVNVNLSFQGSQKIGAFDIPGEFAREWLKRPNSNNKPNADVIKPSWNGMDITRNPRDGWIIDFGTTMTESDAALYEVPFQYVVEHVKPERVVNPRPIRAKYWWRHGDAQPAMRAAIKSIARCIATSEVSKHRLFVWLPTKVMPDKRLIVIACDNDTTFGVLHSRFHEIWSLKMCTWMGVGNDPCYRPTTCFETFPFPVGLTPREHAVVASKAKQSIDDSGLPRASGSRNDVALNIAQAAQRLNELRENWLNPAEWVDWAITPEEKKAGYPKRAIAKAGFEAELKKRTLTNLYNLRPAWVDNAHKALDSAVAIAYGWVDYTAEMPDDEILRRLLKLNLERS